MVVIGVVSGALSRYAAFSASMMQLETPANTRLNWKYGTNPAEGRNLIIRESRQADSIFFMDDDHIVPPQTLMRLLHHDLDVVAPLCLLKEPPYHPVAFDEWFPELKKGWPLELTNALNGLVPVEAVGAAGLLVKKHVLDALGDPWFELGQHGTESMAEDTHFVRKVREAGFSVYVDLETPIGHLTPVSVWPHRHSDGAWGTEVRFNKDTSILVDRAHKKVDPTVQ